MYLQAKHQGQFLKYTDLEKNLLLELSAARSSNRLGYWVVPLQRDHTIASASKKNATNCGNHLTRFNQL